MTGTGMTGTTTPGQTVEPPTCPDGEEFDYATCDCMQI